jgi:NitT/TauT family transport system substrate-binding protein
MLRSNFLAGLAAAATSTLPCESVAASPSALVGFARVRLGYIGNVCEAVTVTAPTSVAFLNERLAAERVRFGSEDAVIAALHAGTIDAASMNLPSLIEGLDRGCHVRVAAGLHTGCMSVLARDAFAFYGPRDLKGQTIGTDRFDGPAMHLLMAILAKQGLDPQRDVKWRGYSSGELDSALQAHVVNCVAVSDPIAYELQTAHRAQAYLDSAGGGFSCGEDIATGHHCFLAVAGSLVERRPTLASALTRAYLNSSAAFGGSLDSLQLDGFYGPFRAGRGETLGMLASYEWHASTDFVVEELELTARDFQRAGLLRKKTDPMDFAQCAFADIRDV